MASVSTLTLIHPLKTNKKISIVMGYYNRRHQLEFTLKTILNSNYKNIEIIVTDDGSQPNETISDFVDRYKIKLIRIDPGQKTWINPVIAYNKAIEQASGEIIIIQNPEVCHLDDICQYVADNLKRNDYWSFSCFGMGNDEETQRIRKLIEMKQKAIIINQIIGTTQKTGNSLIKDQMNGWLNHPIHLPVGYHYLSALYREKLNELGGFDCDYKKGLCHDDDDLVRRIVRHRMDIKIVEKYCIHQYHPNFNRSINFMELWRRNQKYFRNKMSIYNLEDNFEHGTHYNKQVIIYGFTVKKYLNIDDWIPKIPKILHLYWNGPNFTILHYLTVQTFIFYNPDWEVNIYVPISSSKDCSSYFDHLKKLTVNFINVDFKNDSCKLDYLRLSILYQYGGVWSDFDIFYLKKMTKKLFKNAQLNCSIENLEVGLFYSNGNYRTGFLCASPRTEFFQCSIQKYYIDQSIEAIMLKNLFGEIDYVLKKYKNIGILEINRIYPYECERIGEFFNINQTEKFIDNLIESPTVGIHWFNSTETSKKFCHEFVDWANIIKTQTTVCKLLKRYEIQKFRSKFNHFNDYDFVPFARLQGLSEPMAMPISQIHQLACQRQAKGFNVNGSICQTETFLLPPYIDFFEPFNGCYLRMGNYPKISIVMNYYNVKKQLLESLKAIECSQYKNIEVIIVDEYSNEPERLEDILDKCPFLIKLKRLEAYDKSYVKSCINNIGLELATGQIVIIQQPQCLYKGDILMFVAKNLSENDYLSFSTINSNLCAATYRSNLCKIKGFSTEYINRSVYQQEDFLLRLKHDAKIKITTLTSDRFSVINQLTSSLKPNGNQKEKKIYELKKSFKLKLESSLASTIPYNYYCYFEGSSFSYLNYLSIRSFNYYNPHWKINIYISHQSKIIGYWDQLDNLTNLKIVPVDFDEIGYHNDAQFTYKSDYLRWYLLNKHGGLWSDLDIIYVNSIENIIFKDDCNFNTFICSIEDRYNPTGLMMSNPGNLFFMKLMNNSKLLYEKKNGLTGSNLIKSLWPKTSNILDEFPNLKFKIGNKIIYMPFELEEINQLYKSSNYKKIGPKTVGVCLFCDNKESLNYIKEIRSLIGNGSTISQLINKFQEIIKNDYLYKPIVYMN